MKKPYTDPKTGWLVTHEPNIKNLDGRVLAIVSITNPETGKKHQRSRWPDAPMPDIPKWVEQIAKDKEESARHERELQLQLQELYPELASGADVPNGDLGLIKLTFAREFTRWKIILPEKAVVGRTRGKICTQGWAIWYLFGTDDKGEYLDYLASHRMTEDDHIRIYEGGQTEFLPTISGMCRNSPDPEENARLLAEHNEENRLAAEALEAKGFGMDGDEPGGVQIQRAARMMDPEKDES